ncbi:AraC family transcriptional regulator [Woodsholea maritima]|uniref:AraC family transcriptional regulator n=1 Tax=Woodsholea maritima TaxID=240237 RepID=UPI000360E4C5|nr:AraC family transcriptional regulator N-terminal domain-containing protein [Woodsholea maritima]
MTRKISTIRGSAQAPSAPAIDDNVFKTLHQWALHHAPTPGTHITALSGLRLFRANTDQHVSRHQGEMMTLAVALSGRKIVHLGPTPLINAQGQALVMQGHCRYSADVEANPVTPYLAIKLELPPSLVAQTVIDLIAVRSQPARPPAPRAAFVGPIEPSLYQALFRLTECLESPESRLVLAPLILKEIIFHLLQSEAASALLAGLRRDVIKLYQAMTYMEQSWQSPLSLNDIAQHVAMSPSHFAHRFKALAGMGAMHYLKLTRLEEGRRQLLRGASVSETAYALGYAKPSHFSSDFKRRFGLAPSLYHGTTHHALSYRAAE